MSAGYRALPAAGASLNGGGDMASTLDAPLMTATATASPALLSPSPSSDSCPPDAPAEFRQYPARWLVLLVFSLLTVTNAVVWISFAPINSLAAGTTTARTTHTPACSANH